MRNEQRDQARGIEGIAHFFLSNHPDNQPRPTRRAPGAPDPLPNAEAPRRPQTRMTGIAVLAGHLREPRQCAVHFARQWAAQVEPVGLLFLEPQRAWLSVYEPAAEEPEAGESPEPVEGQPDDDPAAMLARLTGRCDTIIVAPGPEMLEDAGELVRRCRHIVVTTTAEPEEMVAAYQVVKSLDQAAWQGAEVALFVCGANDEGEARHVYRKIGETAWEFLGLELGWAGWAHPGEPTRRARLGACRDSESALAAVLETLTRRGPEEAREPQVSAGQAVTQPVEEPIEEEKEEDIEPVGDIHAGEHGETEMPKGNVNPEARAGRREPAEAWPRPHGEEGSRCAVHEALGLRRWPADDGELTQVLVGQVHKWLVELPGVLPLPNQLPGEFHRLRAAVDATGRVWVVGASLDNGPELLSEALGARLWLLENLPEVTNRWAQVRIDRTAPVGMVLAVGSGLERLGRACGQLADIPVRLRRVHLVAGDSGPQVLVV